MDFRQMSSGESGEFEWKTRLSTFKNAAHNDFNAQKKRKRKKDEVKRRLDSSELEPDA